MPISARQRRQMAAAITDHHLAFAGEMFGPDAIGQDEYDRLVKAGKLRPGRAQKVDAAEAAHTIGVLSREGHLPESLDMFWGVAGMMKPRMSTNERAAVQYARDRITQLIEGLASKLSTKTGEIVLEAAARKRRGKLVGVKQDESLVSDIAKRLRNASGDMKRNWLQIAATEVQNMLEEGKVVAMMRHLPAGSDPLVYKVPRPDACPFCVMLYLKNGVPRVFRLSELVDNGTNVGRKAHRPTTRGPHATEWRPVIGCTHPWCQCMLRHLAPGFQFDKSGKLEYVGVSKALVEVETLDKALLQHKCVG